MKLYLLSSDSDTLTGLRLAGIDGALVENAAVLEEAIDRVLSRGDVAVVLVTEIPDMSHPTVDTDSITRYVAQAVGTSV